MRGDEASRSAHELYNANAVGHVAASLGLGRSDGKLRRLDARRKAEGTVDQIDVIVNSLGDADDGNVELALEAGAGQGVGAAESAIASNDEKLTDATRPCSTAAAAGDLYSLLLRPASEHPYAARNAGGSHRARCLSVGSRL